MREQTNYLSLSEVQDLPEGVWVVVTEHQRDGYVTHGGTVAFRGDEGLRLSGWDGLLREPCDLYIGFTDDGLRLGQNHKIHVQLANEKTTATLQRLIRQASEQSLPLRKRKEKDMQVSVPGYPGLTRRRCDYCGEAISFLWKVAAGEYCSNNCLEEAKEKGNVAKMAMKKKAKKKEVTKAVTKKPVVKAKKPKPKKEKPVKEKYERIFNNLSIDAKDIDHIEVYTGSRVSEGNASIVVVRLNPFGYLWVLVNIPHAEAVKEAKALAEKYGVNCEGCEQ
jgi:hypothetical protein